MKAIKIDVTKKSVYFVEIGNDFQDTKKELGCDIFSCPITYDNEDSMYCDDEALLKPAAIKGAFIFPDWSYPIVSDALILGTDDDGDTIDVKSSIEDIEKGIRFIDRNEPNLEKYINQFN